MMATAYGTAVMEERMRPRRHAELAAYVHSEYGPNIGPGFLLAEVVNGGVTGPPRLRRGTGRGILAGLAKAMKALVAGNGRKAQIPDPAR
jgi:hypothetical protein